MSQRKDLHKLIRDVKAQGWRVEHTGRNHLAFRSPQGGTVYTASTPSDYRATKNIRKMLRRYGWRG